MVKSTTKATNIKAPRKPRVSAKKKEAPKPVIHHAVKKADEETKPQLKPKYIFATGRRKTSVANVRLFEGHGKHVVNKKPLEVFFTYGFYRETALKPFDVTGLGKNYYFTAHLNGGGIHSQAVALRHGLAVALGQTSSDVRKILKKNGFLTRDDRKKERKKPGLKRARRAPQWAKR